MSELLCDSVTRDKQSVLTEPEHQKSSQQNDESVENRVMFDSPSTVNVITHHAYAVLFAKGG